MSRGRKGRRPGDPEVTKRAVLAAAKANFAAVGFDRATIRAIAADAAVDPALVHHYFGSKQDLFAAAHDFPVNVDELIDSIFAGPAAELGERLARFYLTVLAVPGSPPLSLIRAATTHESAARMLREFIEDVLLDNAASLIDLPDARLRLALVGSHMIGVVFARNLVGIADMAEMDVERLVAAVAPTIQRYLTDPTALG